MSEKAIIIVPEVGLTEINEEPRVRDLELAERLGMSRPRKIRELIERNMGELLSFGTCPAVGRVVRGNNAKEYWLNEEQSLLVAMLSNAENAPAVRAMLIRVFVAYRRGHLVEPAGAVTDLSRDVRTVLGGMIKRNAGVVVREELATAIPLIVEAVAQRVAADTRHMAVADVSVKEILDEQRVPSKGRRSLQRRVFTRLQNFCLQSGIGAKRCARTNTWLFPVVEASKFVRDNCASMIREHIDRVSGQGHLRLVGDGK